MGAQMGRGCGAANRRASAHAPVLILWPLLWLLASWFGVTRGADGVGGRLGYEQLDVSAPFLARNGRPGSRRARGRLAGEKELGVLAHGYTCRSAFVWIFRVFGFNPTAGIVQ